MTQTPPQSLRNHGRYVPLYHFVLAALLVVNFVFTLARALRQHTSESLFALAVAVSLMILFFYARQFALIVQDRVIRLEMRLRMQQVLPADLFARFGELTPAQLVALRFAGATELPDLTPRVLGGQLTSGGEIKRQIRDWQADWLRA